MSDPRTITERLSAAGFSHAPDWRTPSDGRHTIFRGATAVARVSAKEAIDFINAYISAPHFPA